MTRQRAKRIQPLIQIAKNAVQEAMGYMGQLQQSIESENQKKKKMYVICSNCNMKLLKFLITKLSKKH